MTYEEAKDELLRIIVNWEDKDFRDRVLFSLERQGYVRSEDYEQVGVKTQVWTKAASDNQRGRWIENDPLGPLRLLPAELIASRLAPRLAAYMSPGTYPHELEAAAMNLASALTGRPG
jgi:hypothetical protein